MVTNGQSSFLRESAHMYWFDYHSHSHPNIPRKLEQRHYDELVKGSGISPEIAKANFTSVDDNGLIAKLLGWKRYDHTPGWVAPMGSPAKQFKPDEPIQLHNKPAKYLTQKAGYDAMLLKVPDAPWGDWDNVARDTSERMWITEGTKKAACLMSEGRWDEPCVALPGVWMFTRGGKCGELVPSLANLIREGHREVVVAFDADWRRKKGVCDAINVLCERLMENSCSPYIAVWDEYLGKGIDDAIVGLGGKRLKQHIKIMPYSEWYSLASQIFPRLTTTIPKWSEIELAAYLAEQYRTSLGYNFNTSQWMEYKDDEGYWKRKEPQLVAKLIKDDLVNAADKYFARYNEYPKLNRNLVWHVRDLLEGELGHDDWDEVDGYIPFQNGLLSLSTKQLENHAPGYRFTWALPYNYNPKATCQPIIDWLTSMLGNDTEVQFIRAYLNAVVKSRTDLQVFLELIGAGGTGKSTIIKLAKALVGKGNSHTSSLKKLETSKFETANLYGKKFVEVTDSERYSGGASTLKALTGGDALPYEQKNKQPTDGFYPKCLLILAANEQPQSGDYTSGLYRRRKTIYMNRQVPGNEQRNLIDFYRNKVKGEFAEYIPGLMNWVLELSDKEVSDIIRQDLSSAKQALVETNPLAAWLSENCYYGEAEKTYIGKAEWLPSGEYRNEDKWLYANFCKWAKASNRGSISKQRFSSNLVDLLQNQLKLRHCRKGRDKHGVYILGVSLNPFDLPFSDSALLGVDQTGDDVDSVETSVKAETTVYQESVDGVDSAKLTSTNKPSPTQPHDVPPESTSSTPGSDGKGFSAPDANTGVDHPVYITRTTQYGVKIGGSPEGVGLAVWALNRCDYDYYDQVVDRYNLNVE